jgi:hypothetical protein
VADNLHDGSEAPGKAGRMPQASPRSANRPLDCEAEATDNSKGFQMFRQQMQLQTICNWLY